MNTLTKNIDNVKCGWKTFTYATVSRDKLVSGAKALKQITEKTNITL